jgi:hypothetical protein
MIEVGSRDFDRPEAIPVRRVRFSIAALMAAVAVSALAIAALRSASAEWAGAMLMLVWGVLGLAIAGAVCRRGRERAWWFGFALFGCGYLLLAFWSDNNFRSLPTTTLILFLSSTFAPKIPKSAWSVTGTPQWTVLQIAHCIWALLFAIPGGLLVRVAFGTSADHREEAVVEAHPGSRLPAKWWRRPAVIWLTGSAVIAATALAGSQSAPGLWAGVIFLLTCVMVGMATLGAVLCRDRRRTIWLGAALFGAGYMYLTFGRSGDAGWPYPPTTHLLNALRPGSPPHRSGFPDASERHNLHNERIIRALEEPIPMHFPNDTALEDVLKFIRLETEARFGKGIPIFVDPIGLNFARQTMSSTVRIDVEGAALKNSLQLCLNPLDLTYVVRDGFLMITEAGAPLPAYEDPFLIVGHCLLALLAAGLGGVLAPLVADARGR